MTSGMAINTGRTITVLMPVFNGSRYLASAIESILTQTYTEFELLIIDDGSTDSTPEIIQSYAEGDHRIRSIKNPSNFGLVHSLNLGLDLVTTPLVARMDGDDISDPQRLARQVAFMEHHPKHMFVATSYRLIDEYGKTIYVKRKPANDYAIRWLLRFSMVIEHPSACFRTCFPDGSRVKYDERFRVGEDYDFFWRLAQQGRGAILPDVLLSYRKHARSITTSAASEVDLNYRRTAHAILEQQLGQEIASSLYELVDCYLLGKPATAATVKRSTKAFYTMLKSDTSLHPQATTWLRRHTAGVLAGALLRRGGGQTNARVLLAFAVYARRSLLALLARYLEDRSWLPRMFDSRPNPGSEW